MSKKGIALILCMLVIVVLFILLGSFFLKTINENNLVKRYVNSVRALWVAEAGLARAIRNLPNSPTNGTLDSYQYETVTTYRTRINSSDYYDIISTGIVPFSEGADIRRTLSAVAKRGPVDPSKFRYGIDAANDLCFGGSSCNKSPSDFLDPTVCDGGDCWKEFDSVINFSDMFGYSQSGVEAIATHYTDANFPGTVSGVTWVDVAPGSTLMVTGTETGSGVLIINGDVHFGGSYIFNGIVYVLGNLTARGDFNAYGSVVVASSGGVDSVNGSPTFHYDQNQVSQALQQLSNNFVNIVSWKEGS